MFAWLDRLARRLARRLAAPQRVSSDFYAAHLVNQPPPTAEDVAEQLAAIDARLSAIADVPPIVRTDALWTEMDLLLDRRMRLTCPTVPVVPGRSS